MIRPIPIPGDSAGSLAYAARGDGSVIVGEECPAVAPIQAVRWVSSTFLDLGDLPGGGTDSSTHDVTPDGAVIVGHGSSASGRQAFRWTAAGGVQGLGRLAGTTASDGGSILPTLDLWVGGTESHPGERF